VDLNGSRVLIIGLGKTGIATARFLARKGSRVLITDEKPASELESAIHALGDLTVELELGKQAPHILSTVDFILPSPGVPPFNYLLTEAQTREIPIISEIELAYQFLEKPIIAITGTNGKTTTTRLIGEILAHGGKKIFVGGNIGNPLIEFVDGRHDADYLVVEVSSFQLQWINLFHPRISVLLNITHDHLDYHANFEEYRTTKERIFTNQVGGDWAVLNADDPSTESLSNKIRADIVYFSSSRMLDDGIFVDNDSVHWKNRQGKDEKYPIDTIQLQGNHNLENVMAAILVSRHCGCPPNVIREALEIFSGLPHRMEFVGKRDGVRFYNDSKGTNVGAVTRALETFFHPVILLLGGRDKGGDFTILSDLIRERVKELIIFGEARKQIDDHVGGIVKTHMTGDLKESVFTAWKASSAGDIILLSPGCSSFDEFDNYAERGNYFKELVKQIIDRGDEGIH
jgi:UDP-N-acetylmuramoylalanine--D-glutamate ligase